MGKFIIFDAEYAWRNDWYHAHRSFDKASDRRAMAVKEVVALTAYSFSFDEAGTLTIEDHASWVQADWGGEGRMLEQFCHFLRARDQHTLVGYGSLGVDVPLLSLAAMTAGVRLPYQLLDFQGRWDKRHTDLGLLLKGRGKSWIHLSQIAIRLGIPLELVSSKADVPVPTNPCEWQQLREHVEADALLLALVWSAWLCAQGSNGIRYATAAIAHIAAFRRRQPEHRLEAVLSRYQRQLEREVADQLAIAA
ncbi:hypothetical protein [Porphyrobacter sp. YT40]|uniref:hypothetical protein n=1 Tax=Porphyrobacter sp. YT40 TaxID=2547601 RepID=UPI001144995E|nr:hypothetical protein [Porphyrobacter sp. YT40]QDH35346.1 hypothetical protein E2E27_14090 [Porphyrobacter sp. YT40]